MSQETAHTLIESTALAAAPREGVFGYDKDTDIAWVSDGTNMNQISTANSTGWRRYSWDNPPSSPHAYDDEFDAGSLNAKWTIGSSGTTNPATSGTIDYTSSLTTPIVDAATVPGWLMFQSDNSSVQGFWVAQTYTASTNATFFAKFGCNAVNVSANGEAYFYVQLYNTGDSNETFNFGWAHSGANNNPFFMVNNNGAQTFTTVPVGVAESLHNSGPIYLAVWKKTNVYHCGYSFGNNGVFSYAGSLTKTGVTTLDGIKIFFSTANETPSVIDGIDFFRYKTSLDYSLVNP